MRAISTILFIIDLIFLLAFDIFGNVVFFILTGYSYHVSDIVF